MADEWTTEDLRGELRRFEAELRAAGLKETSINTYVDRTARFIRPGAAACLPAEHWVPGFLARGG
jgi:hypothetical protein